jgi:hypothetical protein
VLNLIETNSARRGRGRGGDFNDFYFYRPLEVVTGYVLPDGTARVGGARFDNLTVTELPRPSATPTRSTGAARRSTTSSSTRR